MPAVEMPDQREHGLRRQPLELDPELVALHAVVVRPDPLDLAVEVDELVGPGQVEPEADDRAERIAFRGDDPGPAGRQVIGVGGDAGALILVGGGPDQDVVPFDEPVSFASFEHLRLLRPVLSLRADSRAGRQRRQSSPRVIRTVLSRPPRCRVHRPADGCYPKASAMTASKTWALVLMGGGAR